MSKSILKVLYIFHKNKHYQGTNALVCPCAYARFILETFIPTYTTIH